MIRTFNVHKDADVETPLDSHGLVGDARRNARDRSLADPTPTLTPTAAAVDIASFYWNATSYYATYGLGFA